MKDLIKLLSVITGFFRSIVTILFLLGIFFLALVDVNLLVAFLDIIGFTGLSTAVIKPILIVLCAVLFIINFIITRHVFKAGDTGRYHPSNLFFSLIFLVLTGFGFISFRNFAPMIFYILFALNGLLTLNSLLGLIARARGSYELDKSVVSKSKPDLGNDYIEFETDSTPKKLIIDEPVLIKSDERTGEVDTKLVENEVNKNKASEDKGIEKVETSLNKDEINETKVINSKEAKKRLEVKGGEKLVFESKNISNDKDTKDESLSSKTDKIEKEALIKNDSTNKISYDPSNASDRETYGREESEAINKARQEKIYDKSRFTKDSSSKDKENK